MYWIKYLEETAYSKLLSHIFHEWKGRLLLMIYLMHTMHHCSNSGIESIPSLLLVLGVGLHVRFDLGR